MPKKIKPSEIWRELRRYLEDESADTVKMDDPLSKYLGGKYKSKTALVVALNKYGRFKADGFVKISLKPRSVVGNDVGDLFLAVNLHYRRRLGFMVEAP